MNVAIRPETWDRSFNSATALPTFKPERFFAAVLHTILVSIRGSYSDDFGIYLHTLDPKYAQQSNNF